MASLISSGQKSAPDDHNFSMASTSFPEGKLSSSTSSGSNFNFWDIHGYRKTVKRCESGHKLLDDLMQFFQERGDIEKAYSKSLQQFSKKWRDHLDRGPEYGSNLMAWKAFLTHAERIADVHMRVKEQLDAEVCDEVRKWTKSKYAKGKLALNFACVKAFDEDFRRAQKPWEKQLDSVIDARKGYFSACKSEKTAKVHYDNAQRNSSSQTVEQIAKLRDKLDVCHAETQQTRESYREALAQLYSIRPRYQNEMTEAFKSAQRFEQERLMFFKTTFYRCHEILNIFSPPSRMNSLAEQLSTAISAADAAKDTSYWSARFGCDMNIDHVIPIFTEYSDANHAISRRGVLANENAADGAVVLRSINARDPGTEATTNGHHHHSNNNNNSNNGISHRKASVSSAEKQRELEAVRQYGHNDSGHANGNGHHASADSSIVDANGEVGVRVWALYAYEAQESDELSFDEGEELLKLTEEDEQGWCKGKLLVSGQTGLFPAAYVSERCPSNDGADR